MSIKKNTWDSNQQEKSNNNNNWDSADKAIDGKDAHKNKEKNNTDSQWNSWSK